MTQSADRTITVDDIVRNASVEIIPLKGAEEKAAVVPADTTVTVTCSPKFGLLRTLNHVAAARRSGHRVVPHLAARMVEERQDLRNFVRRINDLGVDELFVIGGDGEEPVGRFSEAAEILQELGEFDHGLSKIGIGCYPEGHPKISDDVLFDALVRKQQYADYMVSQLCFDASAMAGWLQSARDRGVTLPLRIGVAAPLQVRKLIELSVKIGVGRSVRFLSKQHGMVGNLLLGRAYEPMDLLIAIHKKISFADLSIEGLHLFSFNQVDTTVDWLSRASGVEETG
ncbi:methylenetetrahydrofolate reductase [Actinacidiphila glaucinigra]|uniref:Methylenetetrahydrofolate reductase n=1 Tax=Actinacidiphila glaucinigra TaxID=235986 RepID=A0A239MUS9_9ACTN|nr:methylenetetrahydrofolate reductase [Actinacidiphila glaucinigra]SNT45884.1 methylenetetrahydrofolate reductase (NADPH) [Actinacidiphila glaucinigra]